MQRIESLDDLLYRSEDIDIEYKAAQGRDGQGELPRSFWETYSAMANTEGGYIVLGIREEKDSTLDPVGIPDIERVRKNLWDNLNDREKVSTNLLTDGDVYVLQNGTAADILVVQIPRADRTQRPVYLGKNPFGGTFKRNYNGDYRCRDEDVRRMIAEAGTDSLDKRFLEGFGIQDLNPQSISAYRNDFKATRPTHPWVGLSDEDFLRQLGVITADRRTGKTGLTLAGILMFGDFRPIHDAVTNYVVDYQERPEDTGGDIRWLDRVTTDGSWSGNLYDFYRKVFLKLTADLKVPFRLQGTKRIDESPIHEALREAFVNTLIHADYSGSVGILVVKHPNGFEFRNPGHTRLPIEAIYAGGHSDCRNRDLQKFFQLIGLCEQAGSGMGKILRAWVQQHWREPLLENNLDTETTEMHLPMVSFVPQNVMDDLRKQFGQRFDDLHEFSQRALAIVAAADGDVKNAQLSRMLELHPHDVTLMLKELVDGKFLVREGVGRGSVYTVAEHIQEITGDLFENSLHLEQNSLQKENESVHSEANSVHNESNSEHLRELAAPVRDKGRVSPELMEQTVLALCSVQPLTLKELSDLLKRSPDSLRIHYLNQMVKDEKLQLKYPDTLNHPQQAYRARKEQAE